MANSESTFTAEYGYLIDEFDELQDLRQSDLTNLEEYRTLKMQKNDGMPVNETRLTQLENIYKNKIITSARWNKFQNALVGMQTFIKTEITDYVDDMQSELLAAKDNALIAIDQKKTNIIEYMDDTTAGAIRNDIGVMGDLPTTNKNSLVEAITEIANTPQDGNDIEDNSIGDAKLKPDNKIGSLATLSTTNKTSVVNAINEVKGSVDDAVDYTDLKVMEVTANSLNTYKSNKDANGIYTTVDWEKSDRTIFKRSVLSNPDANGNYQTQTITYYDDGVLVSGKTEVYTITYDADGMIVSEVKQ